MFYFVLDSSKKERNARTISQGQRRLIIFKLIRKLCILKGIFPREPKRTVEGNQKIYYRMKDVMFLAHEPLLHKLRLITCITKKNL
ncbi:hypothetical protein ZIOFF_000014 [Zingiber officinale]|uniref:Uncharacterized protein n=1 Tax=Zingiber officinale TaxID=94328 RepID=A0A8J5I7I8_ZINOF|nr:hypothetical protein ZIOFF_000014 [Zingiber officinale]